MCGRTGVDLVAALCAPRDDAFLQRAAAIVERTDVACSELLEADEWLYGRVGFLRALLGLRREGRTVPGLDDAIQRVVAATLASGRRHGGDGLRYAWHGKEYVGAAHGYAGILYLLLKAGCRDPALRALADWLRDLETREGNWPSSLPDARGANLCIFAMARLAACSRWPRRTGSMATTPSGTRACAGPRLCGDMVSSPRALGSATASRAMGMRYLLRSACRAIRDGFTAPSFLGRV